MGGSNSPQQYKGKPAKRTLISAFLLAVLGIAHGQAPAVAGTWVGVSNHVIDRPPCNTSTGEYETLLAFERCLSRKMNIVRTYHRWGGRDLFPRPDEVRMRDSGHAILASLQTRFPDGTEATWRSIAQGKRDDTVDRWAQGIKSFGKRVYFTFSTEPEGATPSRGTPPEFIAAWRHVHDRFQALGVTNVRYVLTLMSYTFRTAESGRDPNVWYPGAAYVDFLAADGFNWAQCGYNTEWKSFANLFRSFYAYGQGKGKLMMVPEFGTVEGRSGTPNSKAHWFDSAGEWLVTHRDIVAVMYFNHQDQSSNRDCKWFVDTSQSSFQAFQALVDALRA